MNVKAQTIRLIILATICVGLFGYAFFQYKNRINERRKASQIARAQEVHREKFDAQEGRSAGYRVGSEIAERARVSGFPIPTHHELETLAQNVWSDPKKYNLTGYYYRSGGTYEQRMAFIEGFAEGYKAYYRGFDSAF